MNIAHVYALVFGVLVVAPGAFLAYVMLLLGEITGDTHNHED